MARTLRDEKIGTRESRRRLEARGKPYYRMIEEGLHLGYRKPTGGGAGKWVLRHYVGGQEYTVETIATADDLSDADPAAKDLSDVTVNSILDFAQAQNFARTRRVQRASSGKSGPLTVKRACESYVEYLRAHKKTADEADGRLALHVLPEIGDKLIVDLVKADIEKCQRAMVRTGIDRGRRLAKEKGEEANETEIERRSKDSANRVMNMLKAALNRAFEDEDNHIPTDAAWRRVKPFKQVGRARQVHLDVTQSNRLINVTSGKLRWLVTAALLTGARAPHELAARRVRDFRADLGTLSVDAGKTGSRDIVLTKEAIRFFREISAGRAPDDLLLPKDDGGMWSKSSHTRPMADAVKRAKLPKGCTIYSLRHTYASQSLLAGMNIKMLADNMGTSIRMIELHYVKFVAAARRKLVEESAFRLGLKPGKVAALQARA